MQPHQPFVLGFAAYSGTGKTSLLKKLIPRLQDRGLRIGVIKHSHHDFEIDYPGKDSYELRMAGANVMLIASPYRSALIQEHRPPKAVCLRDQLSILANEALDLILVEGFRHEACKKIELHRPSLGNPLLYPADPDIIAVASDTAMPDVHQLPLLDLNNPDAIVDFIFHLLTETQP